MNDRKKGYLKGTYNLTIAQSENLPICCQQLASAVRKRIFASFKIFPDHQRTNRITNKLKEDLTN